MGSMAKKIGRTKNRNIKMTEKRSSGVFRAKDGRMLKKTMGRAIYFTSKMDTPRLDPLEYKRMRKAKKKRLIEESIAKVKIRLRKKKRKGISQSNQQRNKAARAAARRHRRKKVARASRKINRKK